MTDSLVRTQSPEEREYARYLVELETRKQRAAALHEELETLRAALGQFEVHYHTVVGSLFLELDRVRLVIRAYEERIARLQADARPDLDRIERDVTESLRGEQEELRAQEQENRRYEEAFQKERQRPQLPPNDEAELHQLYRDLAKRFHPDLARTDDERWRREPLMQRVNAAMRERDLTALRGLLSEAEITDAAFEARSIGEKLVWAIREIARLDAVIADVESELTAIRSADSFGLWQREEAGEQVIERLAEDLRRELGTAQDELAAAIGAYRHLVETQIR
jgi:hypothetical protein